MPVRTDLSDTVTVVELLRTTRLADATPAVSTVGALDLRNQPHNARILLLLTSFETNVGNTGGTWLVEDAATSGGSYATVAGGAGDSLTVAADVTTQQTRRRTFQPNSARPFVRVTFTGADANTEVDVTAVAVVVPATLV